MTIVKLQPVPFDIFYPYLLHDIQSLRKDIPFFPPIQHLKCAIHPVCTQVEYAYYFYVCVQGLNILLARAAKENPHCISHKIMWIKCGGIIQTRREKNQQNQQTKKSPIDAWFCMTGDMFLCGRGVEAQGGIMEQRDGRPGGLVCGWGGHCQQLLSQPLFAFNFIHDAHYFPPPPPPPLLTGEGHLFKDRSYNVHNKPKFTSDAFKVYKLLC